MAVIEIAKILVRTGQENQTGVPLLDGGEFAWAADTEKLYIGLRREDGGSRDANVEILTENSLQNFFTANLGTTTTNQIIYTYREGTDITSTGLDGEYARLLSDSLDDKVSIKAFRVKGNNEDDDTALFQNAIDKLFLNIDDLNPAPSRKLFVPAGTYILSDTIHIPTGTVIIGEGVGKTIFKLNANTSALFKTCDVSSAGGIGGYVDFDSGAGEGAEFTDAAKSIHIQDLSIVYDTTNTNVTYGITAMKLDCADRALIRNVEFVGNFSKQYWIDTEGGLPNSEYIGIAIRAKAASELKSENIIIDNCSINGFNSGIKSNYDTLGLMIENSEFTNLVQGIAFNDAVFPGAQFGVRNARIVNNKFDDIYEEGIYVGDAPADSNIVSMNNYYHSVGDHFDQPGQGTTIINYETNGNSSINDTFRRFKDQSLTPGGLAGTYYPLINGRTSVDNFYVNSTDITTTKAILRLPMTGNHQQVNVKYNFYSESDATVGRAGDLHVSVQANGEVMYSDQYQYAESEGAVTFNVVPNIGLNYYEVTATGAGILAFRANLTL